MRRRRGKRSARQGVGRNHGDRWLIYSILQHFSQLERGYARHGLVNPCFHMARTVRMLLNEPTHCYSRLVRMVMDERAGDKPGGQHGAKITGSTDSGSRTPCSSLWTSPTLVRSRRNACKHVAGGVARTVLLPLAHTEQLDTRRRVDTTGRLAGQQDPRKIVLNGGCGWAAGVERLDEIAVLGRLPHGQVRRVRPAERLRREAQALERAVETLRERFQPV
jgi:hypothetical protein